MAQRYRLFTVPELRAADCSAMTIEVRVCRLNLIWDSKLMLDRLQQKTVSFERR
ncbi:hypothetical protein IE4803_PB00042 (plasmid) [Rhizobium etli bv. phaseoli str. IE4803]|nr:hypothetical protein IE4803_PB00042 [Rhizobium etli bv. phaseoli str. IE4803]ARO26651.1 hypothetical protein TAL182_PC00036 [Rhizobium sp. TAL182]